MIQIVLLGVFVALIFAANGVVQNFMPTSFSDSAEKRFMYKVLVYGVFVLLMLAVGWIIDKANL
ncbi:hypothetical protein PQU92_15835 [Asticcacaulis sp. BYS171W]|uniref:Uncharacterized protein n=1 Tax=Asticcacaulis aquaticus TaxID=2984212 RepID=A0ABT5HZ93_9CAUL|nr:hypothetical protein [Asticcacaulis aquaticus]MDC7684756.1 hypothetical protein [Asticcacaulis aquaticus]